MRGALAAYTMQRTPMLLHMLSALPTTTNDAHRELAKHARTMHDDDAQAFDAVAAAFARGDVVLAAQRVRIVRSAALERMLASGELPNVARLLHVTER